MPFQKASDIVPNEYFRILFLGRSGCGKSTAALSFPGPRLMWDFDKRARTFAGKTETNIFTPGSDEGWTEIAPIMQAEIDKKPYPYQTTVFCSVTSAQRMFTQDSLRYIANAPAKKAGVKLEESDMKGGANKIGSLLIPGMLNYRYRAECLNQLFFTEIFNIPNNLIVEAHIVNDYNEKGDVKGEQVLAPDKFTEEAKGYFDEIWHFEKEQISSAAPSRWKVYFHSKGFARTTVPALKGVSASEGLDITGKDLYTEVQRLINGT